GVADVLRREHPVGDPVEDGRGGHREEEADDEVEAEVALGGEPAPVEAGPRGGLSGGAHGVGHGGPSATSATLTSKARTQPSRSRLASGPASNWANPAAAKRSRTCAARSCFSSVARSFRPPSEISASPKVAP